MAFFFDRWGVVEATHADTARDAETDAIEAGAQNVEPLEAEELPRATRAPGF
jgi:transcriptional/translational regulatory protein YebC/TACO1